MMLSVDKQKFDTLFFQSWYKFKL